MERPSHIRLMLIGEGADHRLLIRKHVEIEWAGAFILEHRLGADPALDPAFAAAGLDAVVVVGTSSSAALERVLAELLVKPEFAPFVLVLLDDGPRPARLPAAVQCLIGPKLDRVKLLGALHEAARRHKDVLAARHALPGFAQRYRFGSVSIRGHRCIRELGKGGMCKIYLAESERAGALVVLKVFSQVPDVSERIVGFDRFLQEYEIVAGLEHQNIVRIHDLGIADDHAYIAMEHFAAGDLRQRMKQRLSADTALHYLKQMASALDAIHAVGVLHRDLKPANVMLRADGSLCLIDFGLAKTRQAEVELTGSREIFGTPYYMSPEQGHAEAIDARSDLYSLGVVFFEMLTGRKPFLGATAMEVIYKHKRTDLPELEPEFARYGEILQRLLAKAPGERYQSAAELLEAVAVLERAA